MSDNEPDSTPKILVDTDWKAEAQAEKERLTKKAEEAETKGGPRSGEMPPAATPGARRDLGIRQLLARGRSYGMIRNLAWHRDS